MSDLINDELTLTIKEFRTYLELLTFDDEVDYTCDCGVVNTLTINEEVNQKIDELIEEMIVDAQKKICCR